MTAKRVNSSTGMVELSNMDVRDLTSNDIDFSGVSDFGLDLLSKSIKSTPEYLQNGIDLVEAGKNGSALKIQLRQVVKLLPNTSRAKGTSVED